MANATTDGAVRLFVPDHPDLPRHLLRELRAEYAQCAEALAEGVAQDFPDYKERVGYLRGLARAVDIAKEMEERYE